MPKIEIMPSSKQTVIGGNPVIFRCMIKEGIPVPDIEWVDHENNTLNRSSFQINNNMLKIPHASGADEGVYVCRAKNSLGYALAEALLTVQAEPRVTVTPTSPHVVSAGSQVSLWCSSSGDPKPAVQWIAPSNYSLKPVQTKPGVWQAVIEEVKVKDQGTYMCVARSVAGEAKAMLELVVSPLVKEPPQVVTSPSTLTVLAGQQAIFRCNVSGIPSPRGVWSKRTGPLPETASQSEDGVLRIESVVEEDQGEFVCTATNSEGTASGLVRLSIVVSPKITISPRQLTVYKSQPIRLYCTTSPPLPVTWTKINGSISQSTVMDGGILIIDETLVKDAGKYRCQATNEAGTSEAFALVTVFVPPKVKVTPSNQVATLRSNVTFTCHATGIPTPVITWAKQVGFFPKSHIIANGSLSLYGLSGEDQGSYSCTATNAAGRGFVVATLRIEEVPSALILGGASVKTVPVGGNLTLECKGTGIPQPSVIWNGVDRELPNGIVTEGSRLHIINAKAVHGGTYRCRVTNRVGSVQSQIVVFIQDAPQVSITPNVANVRLGGTAELTCIVGGSPTPEVSWHRFNNSLPAQHRIAGGRLLISNVSESDVGLYICRAKNLQGISEASSSIGLKGIIPRFDQNTSSYMTLPTLTRGNSSLAIELFFFPEIADGLILYNDQLTHTSIADFVSFGMSAGHVEFRFDLGSGGPAVIRSKYTLNLYRWHTVKLSLIGNEGTLQVNDNKIRRGVPKGKTSRVNLNRPLYLGGVKNISDISGLAGFKKGFVGCIAYVNVNGKNLNLRNPITAVGVGHCEPCTTNPCQNGGECLETFISPGFVCKCRTGFSHRTCEVYDAGCHPDACVNGRCVSLDKGGYKCVCAVGYTGQRCEEGTKIETPMFEGSSYMSYPSIQGALLDVKLSMRFMAHENRNMLLLFNGQNSLTSRGDFISIAIIAGKVDFRFDLGKGPAVIRSVNNVTIGKWHNIIVERHQIDGSLTFDSEPAVKGQSPYGSIGLNVALPLYIGGLLNMSDFAKDILGVDSGLFGCISDVSVDDVEIDLLNSYIDMRKIKQCKDCLEPCQIGPCINNGTCVPQGMTGYYCSCAQGFTGKNCEFHLVGPGKNRTCLNGGLPFPPSGRVCDCPLGFGGERCGSVVQLGDTASFTGDGFIQYPKSVMARKLGKLESITLNIKTNQLDGLIFWQGQKIGASKGDYLTIGLNEGFLQLRYNLGAGSAILKSRRQLNDGVWHYVKVWRKSQAASLLVDKDELVNGTSPEGARSLNSPGPIFIGGSADIESLTYGVYSNFYKGCIGGIYLQSRALRLQNDAIKGFNILPCDIN